LDKYTVLVTIGVSVYAIASLIKESEV